MKVNKTLGQNPSRNVGFESNVPFELSEVDRGIIAQRRAEERRAEERREEGTVGDRTLREWQESIERELFQTRQHLRSKVDETTVNVYVYALMCSCVYTIAVYSKYPNLHRNFKR